MDEKRKITQLEQRWYVVGQPWGDGTWIVSGSEDPHVGVFVAECESFGISDGELREIHGDIVACAQDKAERIVDEHNKTLDALDAAEAENERLNVMIDRRDMWLEYAERWSAAWKRKAKEFRDWYFYAEKHIFRSQELSQRVNELEENIADAVADAERFKADNARLRAALEAVEWEHLPSHIVYCPWCKRAVQPMDKREHYGYCLRQQALEVAP